MKTVSPNTVVQLHELCLDVCPHGETKTHGLCADCPLYPYFTQRQWRFAFVDALDLINQWVKFQRKWLDEIKVGNQNDQNG